jgi:hypothetical protein
VSSRVPESTLTTAQLLRMSNFRRDDADALDEALAAGGGAGVVCVPYTATGDEDPDGFTVSIGQTLAAADYNVSFFSVEEDIIVPIAWSFPTELKTTTQFGASFAGEALTEDGTYYFLIVEA